MALDAVYTDVRALLAEIQAVAGTAETLVPAEDAHLVTNLEAKYLADELEREIDNPGHGSKGHVHVKKRVNFKFGVELRGAATVGDASPIGRLLRGCGFAQNLTPATSAIYSLVTSGQEFLTMGGYSHGSLKSGRDCRGALTSIELSTDNFAKGMMEFLGVKATDVVDAGVPVGVDTSDFQAPVAIETETFEVDIDGTELSVVSLNINLNSAPKLHHSGRERFVFPERYRPTGVLRVYKETRAVFDPEAIAESHVQLPMFAEIVGGGELIRVDLPAIQLGFPNEIDIEGLAGWEIPWKAIGTSATNCIALSFLAPP
jgi:hypothetical protein